jgi:hypothetical protein
MEGWRRDLDLDGHGSTISASMGLEAWFGIGEHKDRCWRTSWTHYDSAWTIGGGLESGPHGLKSGLGDFFILTKRFFVLADIADRLHISLSLVSVDRLGTKKS